MAISYNVPREESKLIYTNLGDNKKNTANPRVERFFLFLKAM